MEHFTHISIYNFRRLQSVVEMKLRPLCVLIGANGSGKTSLLDTFSLLSASASGNLDRWLSDASGINANLTANDSEAMGFSLSMGVPDEPPLTYALHLVARNTAYAISAESLTQQRVKTGDPFKYIESAYNDIRYFDISDSKLVRPTWEHNPLETSLAQVPKMFQEPEKIRAYLASSTYYFPVGIERKSPIYLPQPLRPAVLPGHNGEDLISCLFNLRETNRDRFEAIEDTLRVGFPGFERLDFPPVAAGMLSLMWKDSNFSHPLSMHQLSDGTLRFLWLATLLQSPGLTAMTLIDEPEASLYPELLLLLADLFREASTRTQLIVATHSDALVRCLEPSEVVALDIAEDGSAKPTWADQLDLDEWLQEYTLDEVRRMGRLGGRP